MPHHGLNNGAAYNTLFANVDPTYVFFNTAAADANDRIRTSGSLSYLMNSLHVEKSFVADGGYTTLKLPYNSQGSLPDLPDEDERNYDLGNYSEQQDHISWGVFVP